MGQERLTSIPNITLTSWFYTERSWSSNLELQTQNVHVLYAGLQSYDFLFRDHIDAMTCYLQSYHKRICPATARIIAMTLKVNVGAAFTWRGIMSIRGSGCCCFERRRYFMFTHAPEIQFLFLLEQAFFLSYFWIYVEFEYMCLLNIQRRCEFGGLAPLKCEIWGLALLKSCFVVHDERRMDISTPKQQERNCGAIL